jgi:hypothetical protein
VAFQLATGQVAFRYYYYLKNLLVQSLAADLYQAFNDQLWYWQGSEAINYSYLVEECRR